MRTKRFLHNSTVAAINQVVILAVGLIIPKIMLEYYGSEINGLVSSITQFISYFRLVEAGIAGAAVYSLYKPLADNNHDGVNGVVSAANKFYIKIGYIFVSLVIGFAIIYPMLVEVNTLTPVAVGLLVVILGANGALEFFTLSKYRVLLAADQKTYVISFASIAHILLNALIVIILSKLNTNIVILQSVALLSIFLRSFILMIYVRVNYKYINYNAEPDREALDKRWDALYLQILGATQSGAPIILATMFTSLKLVSVYSIYNMVFVAINGMLGIFKNGLSAAFGELIVRGEKRNMQVAYGEFEYVYYCLITVVYSTTIVVFMPFINLYTDGINDINYNIPNLGMLFILNSLLYIIKTPQGMMVISAGLYKETRIQSTIQAAIIVLLGLVLAPKFGLMGILIAAALSNFYRTIDLIIFVSKCITMLPAKYSIYRLFNMLVIISLTWISFKDVEITNYSLWILYATGIAFYSVFLVLLSSILFEKDTLNSTVRRMRKVLSK